MPLPSSKAQRLLKHRRQIDVQIYARDDGLWEADARLSDVKPHDSRLAIGIRPGGEPIHDMLLRIVVDRELNIVASGAESLAVPYPGLCEEHGDTYGRLVGLNLLRGFRQALRERVGGALGCTHITELAQVLPTAVVQAMAGEVIDTRGTSETAERPFQLDRCHALRSDGPAVRAHYPRWFRPATDGAMPQATAPSTTQTPRGTP